MNKLVVIFFVILSVISCQSKQTKADNQIDDEVTKEGIMEEYNKMKAELEPQGYIITTDSVDKIFIDNSVTINYNDTKNKKSK